MRRQRSARSAYWLLAAVLLAGFGLFWFWSNASKPEPTRPTLSGPGARPPAADLAQGRGTNAEVEPFVPPKPEVTPWQSARAPAPGTARGAVDNSNRLVQLGPKSVESSAATAGTYPRAVQNVFELQVALARLGLSPGSIDGVLGPQTRSALRAFQQKERLPRTGELDHATSERLLLVESPLITYVVTSKDLARLQPLSPTWLGKSRQTALEYETLLELVSEKSQSAPALVRLLNPEVAWSKVSAGAKLQLPSVSPPDSRVHAAFLTIGLSDKVLEAWDEQTNLLAHFPCSVARQVEKRPVGELQVVAVAVNPSYTFDPQMFPESSEARELKTKLVLPPGPNNPVGIAWIGLDRPGYGIHGTPRPEQVGRTESHGCFRLANWNAAYLSRLVSLGTPVYVQP